jgi:uncharacterized protein (TIGR02145 family)
LGKTVKKVLLDIDGNNYNELKIENQTWLSENLNVSKYRNGDLIPCIEDQNDWANLKTGAWCYYKNQFDNGLKYGKLYNWYAINDPRGLAPEGFHIPSKDEIKTLIANLGGDQVAGGKLKTKGTSDWKSPNEKATNQSGFSALPGGTRWLEEGYDLLGEQSLFWSQSDYNIDYGLVLQLSSLNKKAFIIPWQKGMASSVRCVKDNEHIQSGILIGDLEIYNTDLGEFNFNDAILACEKIGGGWRLPTKDELDFLYKNKQIIGQFKDGFYTSSSKADSVGIGLAYGQRFSDGFQNIFNVTLKTLVRPVRNIKK